ncbi:M23 family metallopeptidase [Aliikangiella sp. G2MR2-5]|uniref:M23 family metallopeptidase n=1 Tax=Aliikangiella sp. G2MR2-5 TaxID=2788943 RepID=UPI0018ABE502|nr:M23 family metallopeptidase [Aliikangiella sp. G2MR2-5]
MNLIKKLSGLILLGFISDLSANDYVTIHAPTAETYACTEHWDGQFKHVGDALGTDCVVQEFLKADGRMFMRSYKGNGYKNEDWYGYGKKVLAPCDCIVADIQINKVTNEPGIMTPGRASSITFKKSDETMILIAHIDAPKVKVGDSVNAGDVVAKIGNNGYSRNPHLHIAAWKGEQPLQIRFDQRTVGIETRREME